MRSASSPRTSRTARAATVALALLLGPLFSSLFSSPFGAPFGWPFGPVSGQLLMAQEKQATVMPDSQAAELRADSVWALSDTGRYHPTKSTVTAMLLSGILPGAGQFYNGAYWKVPIVLGLGVYFVSSWLDNNRRYIDYRDKYRASVLADPSGLSGSRLQLIREFYKDQRDGFTWYFLVLYVVNIVDAYVDASLYDFNVTPTLSLRLMPGVGERAQVMARLTLSMP